MALGRPTKLDEALAALTPETAHRVNRIVNRYLRACEDYGVSPDNLDRVYLEAIEMAKIEEKGFTPEATPRLAVESSYRYDQYVTPTNKDF